MAINSLNEYFIQVLGGITQEGFDTSVRSRARNRAIEMGIPRESFHRDLLGGTIKNFERGDITEQVLRDMVGHVNEIIVEFAIPIIQYPVDLENAFPKLQGRLGSDISSG